MVNKQNTLSIACWLAVLMMFNSYAQEFCEDWKFIKQKTSIGADASSWETVSIPHTWNAVDAQNGGGDDMMSKSGYYRGPASYAKRFILQKPSAQKRVFLRFEAVSSVAEVYLNGRKLGEHFGAFGAFAYEVTPYLKWGNKNDLRVQASNAWRDDLPPLSGDFPVFGGIYRPVHLLVKEPVCISPLQRGSHGVYVRQENISEKNASLRVTTLLDNGRSVPAEVTVCYALMDADGKTVAATEEQKTIRGESRTASEVTLNVTNPHLWHGRMDPYLYTVQVSVKEGEKLCDHFSMKQGFRYFSVDPDQGFMLNGKPYPLWGVNRHQDHENKGWAISEADHDLDISLIDEIGARSIRLAHYPHAEYFFEKCDEAGLLVTAELPLVDCITDSPAFTRNTTAQMNEMIDLYGNYTCVFAYGLYNEMYHKPSPPAESLLSALHQLCKERDPGRLTYGGTNKGPSKEINNTTDLLAFNGYPGWYGGTSAGMKGSIEAYLKKNAHRGIAISEYGAGASIKHHETNPKKPVPTSHWHPEEYQALHHEIQFKIVKDNPRVWGSYIWNMFDFCSVWRNEGDRPGMNDKGIVTHDRQTRKDTFFFYKANWSNEPVLYIAAHRHTERSAALTPIKVYSNLPEVTLVVNAKTIGAKTPDDMQTILWDQVKLEEGANTITVKAGQQSTSCIWHYRPAENDPI